MTATTDIAALMGRRSIAHSASTCMMDITTSIIGVVMASMGGAVMAAVFITAVTTEPMVGKRLSLLKPYR